MHTPLSMFVYSCKYFNILRIFWHLVGALEHLPYGWRRLLYAFSVSRDKSVCLLDNLSSKKIES